MGHILSQKPCWTFALLGWAELWDFISKQVAQYELNSTFTNLASTLRPLPIPLSIRVTYYLKYILIIFMSLQMNGNIVTQLFINGLFFGRTAQSIFKMYKLYQVSQIQAIMMVRKLNFWKSWPIEEIGGILDYTTTNWSFDSIFLE